MRDIRTQVSNGTLRKDSRSSITLLVAPTRHGKALLTELPDQPQAWELVDMPYHRLISLGRRVDRTKCSHDLRLVILGDAATQHYAQALGAVLKLRGWWPESYEAEFDT